MLSDRHVGEIVMKADMIDAEEMGRNAGVNPKTFRSALRREGFVWHRHYERWTVRRGSPEHKDMRRVLNTLIKAT